MDKHEYKRVINEEIKPIDVLDKIKEYAYNKEFTKPNKKEINYTFSFRKLVTSIVSFIVIVLIAGFITISTLSPTKEANNPMTNEVKESEKDDKPTDVNEDNSKKQEPGNDIDVKVYIDEYASIYGKDCIALTDSEVKVIIQMASSGFSLSDISSSISSDNNSEKEQEISNMYNIIQEENNYD